MLNEIGGSPFNIQHCAFNIPRFFEIAGGEWGLVAPAVFKTVVSARKRRKVGSIPTRLRQPARPAALVALRSAGICESSQPARAEQGSSTNGDTVDSLHAAPFV